MLRATCLLSIEVLSATRRACSSFLREHEACSTRLSHAVRGRAGSSSLGAGRWTVSWNIYRNQPSLLALLERAVLVHGLFALRRLPEIHASNDIVAELVFVGI